MRRRTVGAVLRDLALITLSHDTFWLELVLAGAAIAWGETVWLMPGDLVDHPAYVVVGRFAPDWLWDAAACLGGAVQVAAAIKHHRPVRWMVAVAMGVFWVGISSGVSDGPAGWTPTLVPYFALADGCAVCVLVPLLRRLPLRLR